MNNSFLYLITVLIWGSTCIAINYQLGDVAPEASVTYRFAIAALILFTFAKIKRSSQYPLLSIDLSLKIVNYNLK